MVSILASKPGCPSVLQIFSVKKLLMLLRLINSAAYRKVDSGLKMLIESIEYWLVGHL